MPYSRVILVVAALCGVAAAARAQRPTDAADKPPVLTAFAINAGGTDSVSASAAFITLVHSAVGTPPAEYRVSHRADFSGATWMPYQATPIVRDWYDATGNVCTSSTGLSGHRITLYFQVRAALGEEVRIVNGQRQLQPARAESNVLRASICAVGAPRRA
jgi:hypothetical protein